ncbi:hypothetical protein R8201_002097 [Escherichia coli]|nr:hypothetical protein [Escherichia coli]EGO7119448.1 hypothetical protein [Salmonella enterica]ELT4197531.1 hypothetical protein [Escherichia coli]
MFSFVVTEEQLVRFKERARAAIEEGEIEPRILPACRALLDAPGIAPMWSCEGHDNVTRKVVVDGKTTTKVVRKHPHVIVAVTTEGLSYINAIGECLLQQSADYVWTINASRLYDPTQEEESMDTRYWAWGIHSVNYIDSGDETMEERGERLNDAILEAVEKVRSQN